MLEVSQRAVCSINFAEVLDEVQDKKFLSSGCQEWRIMILISLPTPSPKLSISASGRCFYRRQTYHDSLD
ncbi:hypothetical protein Y032_0130g1573 [Ancylostoma ceylanicum]|nr:hypothetical protein Y032_0130g1573 [Ancylostoma ceylanicum]